MRNIPRGQTEKLISRGEVRSYLAENDKIQIQVLLRSFSFFIGQVLDLPTTGNHTQNITCKIRLEIALSCSSWVATTAVFENAHF